MDSKRFFSKPILLAAFATAVSATFTACSDDNSGAVTVDPNFQDSIPAVTTDQKEVVYTGKTLLLGTDRTDLNGAVASRIMNPTTVASADLNAVVFTKGVDVHLSMEQAKYILLAYANNASVVVVDPADFSKSSVLDSLKNALDEFKGLGNDSAVCRRLIGSLETFGAPNEPDKKILGAVACQKHLTYIASDEADDASNRSGESSVVNENGDTIKTAFELDGEKPNAYNYGVSADNLINWMKTSDALDDGANAEMDENGIHVVTVNGSVGPSAALRSKTYYSLTYEIIPLYNTDSNKDTYLIHLNSKFQNSKLNYTESSWRAVNHAVSIGNGKVIDKSYKSTNQYYQTVYHNYWAGPYLRGVNYRMDVVPSGASDEEITISDAKPVNCLNTSVKPVVGLDFSSDHVNLFTPQISLTEFGRSFSYHTSKTLSDNEALIVQYVDVPQGGSSVDWTYAGDQIEKAIVKTQHTDVKGFQRNDWSTDMTWTVEVKNPKEGHTYGLRATVFPVLEEFCNNDTYVATTANNSYIIDLPQPVRSRKPYLITLVGTESGATNNANSQWLWSNDAAIKEKVGVSCKSDFYSYAYTQAQGQKAAVAKFKQYMEALQEIAVKCGSTRNMTFSLKCNDQEGKSVAKCTLHGTVLSFVIE